MKTIKSSFLGGWKADGIKKSRTTLKKVVREIWISKVGALEVLHDVLKRARKSHRPTRWIKGVIAKLEATP